MADWILNWFVEPIITGLTNLVDWIMDLISGSLEWQPSAELLDVWTNILPLANVVFAVVFMIVIYSTATGQGLNNYSIKKILPRLVIGAIAMNVSYYVCMALADLSNILASGAAELFPDTVDTWDAETVVTGLLGNIGNVAIIIFAALSLGTVGLATLTIFLAITARYALLYVLVIISPLAIVCALLPQTEKYFQKWLKTYVQMLSVYPIFMLAWEAIRWVQDSHMLSGFGASSNGINPVGDIMSMLLPIAPLFTIMPIMKMGGGLMSKVAGGIQSGVQKSPLKGIADRADKNLRLAASNIGQHRPTDLATNNEAQAEGRWTAARDEINRQRALGHISDDAADKQITALGTVDQARDRGRAEDDANRAQNTENANYNNSWARMMAPIGHQAQLMSGEKGRRWDKRMDERFKGDEERRHQQRNAARVARGDTAAELSQQSAENAKARYENLVDQERLSEADRVTAGIDAVGAARAGRLYSAQRETNARKQESEALKGEIAAAAQEQQLGRVGLLDRARASDNRTTAAKDIAAAMSASANTIEAQAGAAGIPGVQLTPGPGGGPGTGFSRARAEKLKSATEQMYKNAIGRQSIEGGDLADVTEIVNAETDRGTQIDTQLKVNATTQRTARAGEGGSIEIERAKTNLGTAENTEAERIANAKRKVSAGGTGELVTEQQTLDTTTRNKDRAEKKVEAQSKRREENDMVYRNEMDAAERSIEGSDAVIKARSAANKEADVGHQNKVNAAGRRQEASEGNIKARTEEAKNNDRQYFNSMEQSTARISAAQGRFKQMQASSKQAAVRRTSRGANTAADDVLIASMNQDKATEAAEKRLDDTMNTQSMAGGVFGAAQAELNWATDAAANSKTNLEGEALEQQNARAGHGGRTEKARVEQRKQTATDKGTALEKDALSQDANRAPGSIFRQNVDAAAAAKNSAERATSRLTTAMKRLNNTFGTRAFAAKNALNRQKRREEEQTATEGRIEEQGKTNDEDYNVHMAREDRDTQSAKSEQQDQQKNVLAADARGDNGTDQRAAANRFAAAETNAKAAEGQLANEYDTLRQTAGTNAYAAQERMDDVGGERKIIDKDMDSTATERRNASGQTARLANSEHRNEEATTREGQIKSETKRGNRARNRRIARSKKATETADTAIDAQGKAAIRRDTERARGIRNRLNRGEAVTPAEQALLDRVDDAIAQATAVETEKQKLDNAEDRMKTTQGTEARDQQLELNNAKRKGDITDLDLETLEARGKANDKGYQSSMAEKELERDTAKNNAQKGVDENKDAMINSGRDTNGRLVGNVGRAFVQSKTDADNASGSLDGSTKRRVAERNTRYARSLNRKTRAAAAAGGVGPSLSAGELAFQNNKENETYAKNAEEQLANVLDESRQGEEGDNNRGFLADAQRELDETTRYAKNEEEKVKNQSDKRAKDDDTFVEEQRQTNEEKETIKDELTKKTEKNKQNAIDGKRIDGVSNSQTAKDARTKAARDAMEAKLDAKANQDDASAAETKAMQESSQRRNAQRAELNKKKVEGEDAAKESERILTDKELKGLNNEAAAHASRKSTIDNVINTERAVGVREGDKSLDIGDQSYAEYTGAVDLTDSGRPEGALDLSDEAKNQMTTRRGETAANVELDKVERARVEEAKADLNQNPTKWREMGEDAIDANDANMVAAVVAQRYSTEDNDQGTEIFLKAARNKELMNDSRQARRLYGALLENSDFRAKNPLGATYLQYVAAATAAADKARAENREPEPVLSYEEALASDDPSIQDAMLKNLDEGKVTSQDYDVLEMTLKLGETDYSTVPPTPPTAKGIAAAEFVRKNMVDKYMAKMTVNNKSLADVVMKEATFLENSENPGDGQRTMRHSADVQTLAKLRKDDIRAIMGDVVQATEFDPDTGKDIIDPNTGKAKLVFNDDGTPKMVAATFKPKNPKKKAEFNLAEGNRPDDMEPINDRYEELYNAEGDPQGVQHMIDIFVRNITSPNPQEYEEGALDLMAEYAQSAGIEIEKVNGKWQLRRQPPPRQPQQPPQPPQQSQTNQSPPPPGYKVRPSGLVIPE
jgi:hypothetical protein